jgi:hypothetical protein
MEKIKNIVIMDLMRIRILAIIGSLILLSGCSEFALLMSGASIAATQNTYARAYNGVDVLTIMSTEKSIKKHAYDKVKEVIDETK